MHIRKYDLGLAPESVLREMSLLQAIFEMARTEWRLCRTNPVKDINKKGLKQKGKKKIIPQSSIDAIVRQLGFVEGQKPANKSQETAIAFLIALETGMRDSEMLTGEWVDVYLQQRYVHLDKSKNGDERDVPLSKRAVQLYELMVGRDDDKVFTVDSASRDTLFRAARAAAGLQGFTFHQSRHTAITRLAKKFDILDLAKVVGHRDLKSLMSAETKHAIDLR